MSDLSVGSEDTSGMPIICDCDSKPVGTDYFSTSAFEPDLPTVRPGIFLWKFLNEEESVFVLKPEVTPLDITNFLDKKLESSDEIIKALMYEAIKFCRDRLPRDPKLISSFTGCLHFTHCYFTASKWRTPEETYNYFKESLLSHAVECPPFSMEIFTPSEAKEAILYFFETYLRNLPLIRILCQPQYKLRLTLDGDDPPASTKENKEDIKKK